MKTSAQVLLMEIERLDPVKPREPILGLFNDEPTGYFESDRDWMEENRFTAVWLLENLERIKQTLESA